MFRDGVHIADSDGTHALIHRSASNLSADRTVLWTTGDADVTITSYIAGLLGSAAASDARTTLGLGTAAVKNTGTSGNNVPLLDGANTWSGKQTISLETGVTGIPADVLILEHASTGTPAAGFGLDFHHRLESTTTASQDALQVRTTWVDATHATRKSRTIYSVFDTAQRDCVTMEASGSAAMIGFLGASASARLASPDLGTLATTFGLASGTPTFNADNLTGTVDGGTW